MCDGMRFHRPSFFWASFNSSDFFFFSPHVSYTAMQLVSSFPPLQLNLLPLAFAMLHFQIVLLIVLYRTV